MTDTTVASERAVPGLDALRRTERRRPGQESIARLVAARAGAPSPSPVRRVFGGSPVGAAEREAFDEARGERIVGRELDALPSDWIVFHSLSSSTVSSVVDHVVVGPGGLFAVTTRFADGADVVVADDYLLAGGKRTPFAREAAAAARRTAQLAGRALPPHVCSRGIVVIAGARRVRRGSRAVDVRESCAVRDWLLSQPAVLDAETIERVAVRMAETYEAGLGAAVPRGTTAATAVGAALFARLERETVVAGRVRGLWRLAGVVGIALAVWVSFAQLPAWLALQLG